MDAAAFIEVLKEKVRKKGGWRHMSCWACADC